MGLFDTIRRAVGGDDSSTDGDEQAAGGDRPSDDGPELLDTATLDPPAFREYAERVVGGADPLTFDPGALARLDTAIKESYDGKTAGDAAGLTTYTENTVRFGSYLGELLVRAYDGEWVQSDGRWGVTVAGPADEVTVAVFDVAARSFGDDPVFAAVVTRLESELALEKETDDEGQPSATDGTESDSVVSKPTRVVHCVDDDRADENAAGSQVTETEQREKTDDTDDAASASSQAVETEPTRVVRRVESESEDDNQPDDTDPTPVVSRITEEPQDEGASERTETDHLAFDADGETGPGVTDASADDAGSDIEPSTAETAGEEPTFDANDVESSPDQSSDDTAGEQSTGETPTGESASGFADDEPAADTADAVEPTADDTEISDTSEHATPPDTADKTADTADTAADTTDEAADTADEAADTADEAADTADTAAADDNEQSTPPDSEPTADPAAQSWESGTVRTEYADTAVEFADFWGEHDLDFSPASLSRLDDLVDSQWDDERFAETTFGSDASFDDRAFTSVVRELGGYFGEVLVRHLDGEWTDETDHEAAVVVGGSGGQFAVPVFDVAKTSLRKQAVFGRSYDALLDDLGRDGPAR